MVENLLALIGRFHPLIIHLPIGFIVMGLLIELNKKKFNWSNDSLKFIFFWASMSGVLSIISGYFQYQKGGYLWDTVGGHFYAGITTVVLSVSFFLYLNNFKYFNLLPRKFYTLGHLIILTITGHLGGNITHGEDHLIEPINNLVGMTDEQINITMNYEDYANKSVFINLIQPILDDKCVKCHNQKKTKGGLQMHNFESLVKGGKNGIIFNFDDPELSEILVRIHLPKSEKKHMPPSGGKQLSREEIKMLSIWIHGGSTLEQTVSELELNVDMKNYFFPTVNNFLPEIKINPPDYDKIQKLKSKKILVSQINKNSNFLSVSTINKRDFNDEDINKLFEIKENIISLDFNKSSITDSAFLKLIEFPNLTILKLNNTKVRGKGIENLSVLKNLKRINLTNTLFDEEFIESFNQFPALEKVYLFQEDRDLSKNLILNDKQKSLLAFGSLILEEL